MPVKTKAEGLRPIPIELKAREIFPAAEAAFTQAVDERTGRDVIRADVVIIRPGESANRRFYSAEAIRRAVDSGFWENSPMFIDHPSDLRMPYKRPLTSLVAGLSNVRTGPAGEAIGTATFFNHDFGKLAMEAKSHIGISPVHYFKGQRYRGTDGHNHERVDEFLVNHSVDFVAFPAAGGEIMSFLPAQESEEDVDWKDLTAEELAQHRPDLVEAIQATAAESESGDDDEEDEGDPVPPAPPQPPSPGLTMADIKKVVGESIDERLSARDKQSGDLTAATATVKTVLDKSGLPEPTRARLMKDLLSGSNFENIEALAGEAVEGARAELKAAGAGPRVSGMGASGAGGEGVKKITLAEAAEQSAALGALNLAFGTSTPAQSGKEN